MSVRLRKGKQSKSLYQELAALNSSRTDRAIIDLMKLPKRLEDKLLHLVNCDHFNCFEDFKHHMTAILADCNLMPSHESVVELWEAIGVSKKELYAERPDLD